MGALLVLVVAAAPAFQDTQPAKSPYERRGLYHATILGRVVSPAGEGVSGVHVQLQAGPPRALPLADVVTGADGRFRFAAVNSSYPPYLAWFPPEEWMAGRMPVVSEHFAEIDAGVIRLRPASVVRVAVEVAGGEALTREDREPTVILTAEPNGPRLLAEKSGTEQVISGIPFENGKWEVHLYTKSGAEEYTAPFHLPQGRRDQKFTLRLLRNTVKLRNSSYSAQGEMEVRSSRVPAAAITKEFQLRGRVAGPDGSPVDGAFVSTFSLPPFGSFVQWVRTDKDGSFDLTYRSTHCIEPSVSFGDSDYWNLFFSKPSLREIPCERWLQTPQTIVMPKPSRLAVRVAGVDAAKVRAAWWHDSFGWQRFSSLRPWLPAWGLWHGKLRVEADGYLPLTQTIEFPRSRSAKEQLPAELPMEFRFDASVRRALFVRSAGKPLAGATVDVESIVNLSSDERRLLKSYVVPANGRLQLLGGGDQLVEAFVYAKGFEPRRVIWNPGAPLVVEMTARREGLEFPASGTAVAARIRVAGSPRAVRTVVLSASQRTVARVVPGRYDITCYDARGAVAGYQRLAVADRGALVNCAVDQRPRLTVRLPPGENWRLAVTESTPSGRAVAWVAMIPVPQLAAFSEAGATVMRESKTELVLALAYAGLWHIEAQRNQETLRVWRDVELIPGASLTLALPTERGTLKGSMRTYGGGLARSEHGFAGPRLQLIADDPAGWSVTEYLPQRDSRDGESRHHFTLAGIPVGQYHLFQHLIGEPKTYTYGGRTATYTEPVAAWGGIPVRMERNAMTVLKDFREYRLADLRVRVTDANGRAVENATLRIRDRMSDAWRQVEENPWQLEQAAHAIPYPTAVRLAGGMATLPRIREGWLEVVVECDDDGGTFRFTIPVSPPSRELRLTLPAVRR